MNTIKRLINSIKQGSKRRTTRGRRTRRRLRNTRYNFKGTAYNESEKPQRYGPGQTFRNIEAYFEAFRNSYFNLQSLLSGNTEHQVMCTLYNFMKIKNIAIIFYPAQAQISAGYLGIQLNWNNQDDTNIQQEDNTKMIPIYRTRKYFYKFVPLDMPLLLGTTDNPVVINMANYMRTSDSIVIPGVINFDSQEAFTARVRVIMRMEYRGSKVPDSTGLTALVEKVKKTEQPRHEIKRMEIKIGDKVIKKEEAGGSELLNTEDEEDSGDSEFLSDSNAEEEKQC